MWNPNAGHTHRSAWVTRTPGDRERAENDPPLPNTPSTRDVLREQRAHIAPACGAGLTRWELFMGPNIHAALSQPKSKEGKLASNMTRKGPTRLVWLGIRRRGHILGNNPTISHVQRARTWPENGSNNALVSLLFAQGWSKLPQTLLNHTSTNALGVPRSNPGSLAYMFGGVLTLCMFVFENARQN